MSVVNAHDAAKTLDCKVAGCAEESASATGIYGRLCERHAEQRRQERAAEGPSTRPTMGGREPALRDLIAIAKQIDRQAARVEKLRAAAERALAAAVKSAQMEQSRIEARYAAASRAAGFQT